MDYKLLEKLCLAVGISGDEENVRNIIIEEIKNHVENIEITPLGNIIANKKGKKTPEKKIMLSAHMDEVGFMVNEIDSDGYLGVISLGVDSKLLVGKTVYVNQNLKGVFSSKPIHLQSAEDAEKIIPMNKLKIDIGAVSKEDAEEYVGLGDYVNFEPYFEKCDNTIKAKSLDDRVGCLLLIEMIKSELLWDMTFAFTVSEEAGFVGAKTAAYVVNPDICIAVEGTIAADVMDLKGAKAVTKMGDGVSVSMVDQGTIYDRAYFKKIFEISKDKKIKAQVRTSKAGANDCYMMHKNGRGARAVTLAVPCRYIHAPISFTNTEDIESAYKMLIEFTDIALKGEV